MGRKKKPTVEEVRSIREQMEAHVFELVIQFEQITGMTVTGIEVKRYRRAGFGATDQMEINIITHL